MVKPRDSFHRSKGFKPGFIKMAVPESVNIGAWSPRDDGKNPTQVHLVIHLPDLLGEVPLVMRFKSPVTLGFLIEELAFYRREVWPDAEPVNVHKAPGGEDQ